MLHTQVSTHDPRNQGHDSWAPTGKVGEGVSIYFIGEDALAIYRQVTSRGIKAKRPFVGNLSDPDGYQIYFEAPPASPKKPRTQSRNT